MAIDVVLCFRDESGSYFINPYVTLVSIFENTKERIIVHIMHDETVEHGRKHLEELCHSYGHSIEFHHVPDMDADVVQTICTRFHLASFYQYYIHTLVAADKAIYLDCDVIVNRDINDLYEQPLGERLFASTLDWGPYWKKGRPAKRYKKTIEYLGLVPESYISAGLLLINLKRLRALSGDSNIFVRKTAQAVQDGIELPYIDMDIINSIAASVPDGVLVLDERYNLWHKSMHLGLADLDNTIFHYVSKPDKKFFPAHLLFWKYYAMTPFAGDMFERMSKAYCSGAMDFVTYYALRPRHRRHARDLLKYGFGGMLLRAVGRKLGMVKE